MSRNYRVVISMNIGAYLCEWIVGDFLTPPLKDKMNKKNYNMNNHVILGVYHKVIYMYVCVCLCVY